MKFGIAKIREVVLRRSAESAELTPQDKAISCRMVPRGRRCLNTACGSLPADPVSAFAALGDTLRPKSFAGLFGDAPSIALATLVLTLSQKGAPFVALAGRSMIVGPFALAAYSWTVCVLLKKFLLSSWTATMAALNVWFAIALGYPWPSFIPMIVQFKPSAIRQTRGYEYLLKKFVLGGAMTAAKQALVACMRKLLVILNAIIRDRKPWLPA